MVELVGSVLPNKDVEGWEGAVVGFVLFAGVKAPKRLLGLGGSAAGSAGLPFVGLNEKEEAEEEAVGGVKLGRELKDAEEPEGAVKKFGTEDWPPKENPPAGGAGGATGATGFGAGGGAAGVEVVLGPSFASMSSR